MRKSCPNSLPSFGLAVPRHTALALSWSGACSSMGPDGYRFRTITSGDPTRPSIGSSRTLLNTVEVVSMGRLLDDLHRCWDSCMISLCSTCPRDDHWTRLTGISPASSKATGFRCKLHGPESAALAEEDAGLQVGLAPLLSSWLQAVHPLDRFRFRVRGSLKILPKPLNDSKR